MQLLKMAEVLHLKDKGIPLKIDGTTRFVKGATKYTTCSDVIKMVLKKTGVKKEYRHLFTIYEVTNDGEVALPCKSKITKVVEAWKGMPNKLVMRKAGPLTPVPVNEKKKRWNLARKSKEQLAEIPKTKDTYVQTLQSIVDMVDKRRTQFQPTTDSGSEARHVDVFSDSTTDSDSSIDEFLSKLDHSKMAGLLNFFAAMATRKQTKDYRRRTGSTSTQGSDSSDTSPVKPRKMDVRKVRQPLLKKTRSRNSRSRLKEAYHMHPNKMHAVKGVNYGFIDSEPRIQDKVYSLPDVRPNPCQEVRLQTNSKKIFTARRRLIPSRKSNSNMESKPIQEPFFKFSDPVTGVYLRNEPFRLRRLSGNCKEIWCESPIQSVDSGHEESTDSSSDLDTAFVKKDNSGEMVHAHRFDTPENGRIFRFCANNEQPLTSSVRKLVEYSITDDELDDTDSEKMSELGTERHDTNVDDKDNSPNMLNNENNEPGESFSGENSKNISTCGYSIDKDAQSCHEPKHDVTNYIKSLFGKAIENEDEEMNSFMKSMVLNDSSDEGLSSMGSDLDTWK